MSFANLFGQFIAAAFTAPSQQTGSSTEKSGRNDVTIETMMPGGSWFPVGISAPDSFAVNMAMGHAQRQNPGQRIRAIDSNGRLVDMLM